MRDTGLRYDSQILVDRQPPAPHTPHMTKTIGKRVKQHRDEAGLTQQELADLCGWQVAWVQHIEAGRRNPNAANLAMLAGALGCRTDDLLPPERPRGRRMKA